MAVIEVWVDERRFEFDGGVVTIGRSVDCDVPIHDHRVSRRHLELRCERGSWALADSASANGTFLGGLPMTEMVLGTTVDLSLADPDDGIWVRLAPPETTQTIPLVRAIGSAHAVRIGRARDNDIVLDDDRASRYHAEFMLRADAAEVRDCNSVNGTKVDGVLVDRAEVRIGSLIEIGDTMLRVVRAQRGPLLEVVAQGVTQPFDPALRRDRESGENPVSGEPRTAITSRERELVALVAGGASDKQIAAALFISVATVRSHLDRIQVKTGRRRRADLTRLAFELGVTPMVVSAS